MLLAEFKFAYLVPPPPSSLPPHKVLAAAAWWLKYWSFSFTISPSKEHSGLISFRIDWLDLLAVQGWA